MDREDIFKTITDERNFHDRKWGTIKEHGHEVGAWITIMRKLLNDAEIAWTSDVGDDGALLELRKVLAVGVACAEQHGLPPRW